MNKTPAKKEQIAKIDKSPRKQTVNGKQTRSQQDAARNLLNLIKFNHSILEYMKKEQQIEEAYVLLEQHAQVSLTTDEELTDEYLTDEDELTQRLEE